MAGIGVGFQKRCPSRQTAEIFTVSGAAWQNIAIHITGIEYFKRHRATILGNGNTRRKDQPCNEQKKAQISNLLQ